VFYATALELVHETGNAFSAFFSVDRLVKVFCSLFAFCSLETRFRSEQAMGTEITLSNGSLADRSTTLLLLWTADTPLTALDDYRKALKQDNHKQYVKHRTNGGRVLRRKEGNYGICEFYSQSRQGGGHRVRRVRLPVIRHHVPWTGAHVTQAEDTKAQEVCKENSGITGRQHR
jgi:hypothetical protein